MATNPEIRGTLLELWKLFSDPLFFVFPPAAEYALIVNYQFWQPTFHGIMENGDTTIRKLPSWANGLFYPSWSMLYGFTA